jgi:5-hydroxyisourate hydrolase
MSISTHVLDAATGRPAAGVRVVLEKQAADTWTEVNAAETDRDGRIPDLATSTAPGVHRLRFDVEGYAGADAFFPEVVIVFRVTDPDAHHHVPLLLSPFAYSTYRGS